MNPLIAELRNARAARGLSKAKLARRAGVLRQELERWEAGRVRPNVDTFVAWANALGFDVLLREQS